MAVEGWRWGDREGRLSARLDDDEVLEVLVKGTGSRGVRDSEVMVMGRAKREVSSEKDEKAERRAEDAVWAREH